MQIRLEDKVLSYTENRIIEELAKEVSEKIPEAVSIILFGSRARGISGEESDLDVAVVLDVENVSFGHWRMMWDIKWHILESFNAEEFPLSLILLRKEGLIKGNYGLESELRKEGIVIWERTWQRQNYP